MKAFLKKHSTPLTAEEAALPEHIAIIMDGNGRWAREHGMALAFGHREGGEAIRRLVELCRERPYIRYLTLYAFSFENWKRSEAEVSDLMNLMRDFVKRDAPTLLSNNIRLRFVGELEVLNPDIYQQLQSLEAQSAANTGLTVTIAVSYGSRQEITTAMKRIAQRVAERSLAPEAITDATVTAHLHTQGLPDPDLLIRTGGDSRLSNFLLWQCAYTELYFDSVLWPDFGAEHLDRAVADYGTRERRFGKRNSA